MDHDDATSRDLTCRELTAFVADYLDDALPPAARVAFEAHLGACEDCIVYLRSYRETIRLEKAHGKADDQNPPEMPEELVQAILAGRRDGKP
jgi:anti-sigma factor RsiW